MNNFRSLVSVDLGNYPGDDSFKASKKLCELIRPGVVAIFGPNSPTTANHVQGRQLFIEHNSGAISANPCSFRRMVIGTTHRSGQFLFSQPSQAYLTYLYSPVNHLS